VKKLAPTPGWHEEARLVIVKPDQAQQRAMHRDVFGANVARNWVVERYRADQEARWQANFVLGLVRLLHGPLPAEREMYKVVNAISLLGWGSGQVPSKADRDRLLRRALSIEVDLLAYGKDACATAIVCSLIRIFAGHARWKVRPGLPSSFEDLRWLWNKEKPLVLPWWHECSKEALASGIEMGALAIKNHHESRLGMRMGARVGMPPLTSIYDGRSYAITTGSFGLADAWHLKIPKVPGLVELAEDCGDLLDRNEDRERQVASAHREGTPGWHL